MCATVDRSKMIKKCIQFQLSMFVPMPSLLSLLFESSSLLPRPCLNQFETTIVRNTFRIPISILESTSCMLQWNVTRFVRNIFAHRPWLGRRRPGAAVFAWGSRFSFPSSSSKNRTQSPKREGQKHFQIPGLRRYTRRKLFFRGLSSSRVLPCHSSKMAVSSRLN